MHYDATCDPRDDDEDEEVPFDDDFTWDEDMPSWGG